MLQGTGNGTTVLLNPFEVPTLSYSPFLRARGKSNKNNEARDSPATTAATMASTGSECAIKKELSSA